jgi:hypothetical protein
MQGRTRLATAAACTLAIAPFAIAAVAPAATTAQDALGRLMGRWSGTGTVTPATGPSEQFRCIVTYRPSDGKGTAAAGGSHMQQNLRCSSPNYRLDAATTLRFENGVVSGQWEERTNSLTGDVHGKVTPQGFEIFLSGRFFAARMTVAGSDCAQDVKLTPVKADQIKELSASLRKC